VLLVYIENITPRHQYIFDFFFREVLGLSYSMTDEVRYFIDFQGPKISYGKTALADTVHFAAHPVLSDKGLKNYKIVIFEWQGLPVFFRVDEPSELPYDPFAIAFYLITRYEEYLPIHHDEHSRFPASESIAYRGGFLGMPLVNILADKFKALLIRQFPGLKFRESISRFIPTFDVDIAYAHLAKGLTRAAAAWTKLLLTGQFKEMLERLNVLTGNLADPYDNFDWQVELATQYGLNSVYFILLGDFSRFDRNTDYRNPRFRKIIEYLSRNFEIGIHPSYFSFLDKELYLKEKCRLENIIGKPVRKNRFHFLRLKFPESFRLLTESGITDDYSLGYSTTNGYRAGTANPFRFYDIEKDEIKDLTLHPFTFMDSAMIDHKKLSPGAAMSEMQGFLEYSYRFGGETIGIWHNYALSEKGQYAGWRKVLEEIMEKSFNRSL